MKFIEISSYPKSGNTWFRHLVKEFLEKKGSSRVVLPAEKVVSDRKKIRLEETSDIDGLDFFFTNLMSLICQKSDLIALSTYLDIH